MILSDLAISRPVFATVLSVLVVVLGLAAASRLPVRQYPAIDRPVISISTRYPGAGSEVVENSITKRIEGALSGIEGIVSMTSTSRDESSSVSLEFAIDRDIDAAAADVRDELSRIAARLPDDAAAPVLRKASADSSPVMWIALRSATRDTQELSDFAERNLADALSVLPGVANLRIGGQRRYAMRIWLDPALLSAYNLTPGEVRSRLLAENVEFPAGRIESEMVEIGIRASTRLREVADFEDLVLRTDAGGTVRLADVAAVEIGAVDYRRGFLVDGLPGVGLGVIRQSTANTLEVSQAVRAELERLRPQMPEDITIAIPYDEALFVEASIREVVNTLLIALGLVVAVILLFLQSARATVIPAATIPVSIIGTAIVMLIAGYSLNVLTLLAMVLAIGLVVDDAIVVLENIYRRREMGEPALVAARRGAAEVGMAVISTTLVLVAVFTPLSFMQDETGRLFGEFGIALAAAVCFSSLIALTLGAMLCSRLLTRAHAPSGIWRPIDRALDSVEQCYRAALAWSMRWWFVPLSLALTLVVAGITLFGRLPEELAPVEDQGRVVMNMSGPEGVTLAYTEEHTHRMLAVLEELGGGPDGSMEHAIAIMNPGWGGGGAGAAFVIVGLRPWHERSESQQDFVARLRGPLMSISGVRAFVSSPPPFGRRGGGGRPVQLALLGDTTEEVLSWAEQLVAAASELPELEDVQVNVDLSRPQMDLTLDRERAADLGVSLREAGDALQILLGSLNAGIWEERGQEYDVILQADDLQRRDPSIFDRIQVRGRGGRLVPVRELLLSDERGVVRELNRIERRPAVVVQANLAEGVYLGPALDAVRALVSRSLPQRAQIAWQGQSKQFVEASGAIYLTFLLALGIVYLVLAAQFESWIHPIIIITTVPLGLAGAVLALWLGGMSNNIYAQIGGVMLIGLMAKNGILLVEFANQLRDRGLAVAEAIREAAAVRLRPILMTVISTIAGAVPLALASGAGAESRRVLGLTLIGGMSVASLLTLFVIPVVYLALARFASPPGATAERLRRQEAELEGTMAD